MTQIQRGSWNSSTQTFTPDNTQQTTFYYDSNPFDSTFTPNSWGRLAAVAYGQANGVGQGLYDMYSYTSAGLTTGKRLTTCYGTCGNGFYFDLDGHWTYDSEGRVLTATWPHDSGGVNPAVTYGYDAMGRPYTLSETWSGTNQRTIINTVSYDAADRPLQYSGDAAESWTYNALEQVTAHMGVQYSYGLPGKDNGQIASIGGVSYTYDAVNRLATAQAGSTWGQSFVYDQFGNLLQKNVTAGSAPSLQITVDSGNHVNGDVGFRRQSHADKPERKHVQHRQHAADLGRGRAADRGGLGRTVHQLPVRRTEPPCLQERSRSFDLLLFLRC